MTGELAQEFEAVKAAYYERLKETSDLALALEREEGAGPVFASQEDYDLLARVGVAADMWRQGIAHRVMDEPEVSVRLLRAIYRFIWGHECAVPTCLGPMGGGDGS